MSNELGNVRQSSVIMNYGPGAILDFRVPVTGAAVSIVAAGLEQWEKQTELAGASVSDLRRFTEPRLKEKLGVSYFRLPPVAPDNLGRQNDSIGLGNRPGCHVQFSIGIKSINIESIPL